MGGTMNRREILGYNAKITPVKPLNDEMTLCKCYVLALGKNRNYSHISDEATQKALPTIYNIPVVGHVYVDEDGEYHMGGHDMTIVRDEDNKYVFKSMCVPFGVVPENNDIHYETFIDSTGNEATYLVSNVVLWTGRYPDLCKAIYSDDIYFGQSMEINVKAYETLEDDDKYIDIKDYSFSALCLLGKSDDAEYHVEPCFPDSRVEPYHFSLDDSKFNDLMQEFKQELSECFHAIKINKGGEERLTIEVYNSVLAEFGLKEEDLSFEITENMTEEELREKLAEFDKKEVEETPEEEPKAEDVPEETEKDEPESADEESDEENHDEEPEGDEEPEEEKEEFSADETQDQIPSETVKFSQTYTEKVKALSMACDSLCECNDENCIIYCLCDFDEKYAYIREIKFGATTDAEERYCRVEYTVSEDNKATFEGEFVTVVLKFLTLEEVEKVDKERAEYEELKQFRAERLEADRINEYDAVVSEFSDLTGNEEFSQLVEDKMSFETAEALREKCFAIRGRTMSVKPDKKPENKMPIDFSKTEEPYGGFFSKYPPKSGKIK